MGKSPLQSSNQTVISVTNSDDERSRNPSVGSATTTVAGDDLADKIGDAHSNTSLSRGKLIISLIALSSGLFASFCDQTGVTVALPIIAEQIGAEQSINWAGTASLLANTVCQVLFGRLADIFGRKNILMTSLLISCFSDLACGLAQTPIQFFIFRAFSGIGTGGIQSLTMVMLSDICTLQERGKYQGILGAQVGLGNAVGPFLMAAFAEHTNSWRNFYYMLAPLNLLLAVAVYVLIDTKQQTKKLSGVLTRREKLMKLDYLGMLFSTAGLTLILVPLSSGGSTYPWDSAKVIVMFIVGGLCLVTFVFVEWKVPELPMIPLRLFKRRSLNLILTSNFLFGIAYYGFMYYLPYYYQIVRGQTSVMSSVLLLPFVVPQALASITSGRIVSATGQWKWVVLGGYSLWTLGCGLLLLFSRHTNYGAVCVILACIGVGVGFTFQPTMVAAQSHAKRGDRAVVISTRNVLRSFGGSVGVAVAGTIVSNSILNKIDEGSYGIDKLSSSFVDHWKQHIYQHIDTANITHDQLRAVQRVYMYAIRNFFYLMVPLIGLCLISTLFVGDHGLHCIDEPSESTAPTVVPTRDSSVKEEVERKV
ncbi:citrate exporter 1 [Diutina catenulata]